MSADPLLSPIPADCGTLEDQVRWAIVHLEPPAREAAARRSRTGEKYTGPAYQGGVDAVVGHHLGMSATRYYRIRSVMLAVDDDTLTPEQRKAAREALDYINTTGGVALAYERFRGVVPAKRGTRLSRRPRPRPREPEVAQKPRLRRKPLLDRFDEAVYHITRKTNTLVKAIEDDRWPSQRMKVAPATRSDLQRAIDRLTAINQQFFPAEGDPTP